MFFLPESRGLRPEILWFVRQSEREKPSLLRVPRNEKLKASPPRHCRRDRVYLHGLYRSDPFCPFRTTADGRIAASLSRTRCCQGAGGTDRRSATYARGSRRRKSS